MNSARNKLKLMNLDMIITEKFTIQKSAPQMTVNTDVTFARMLADFQLFKSRA